jgi:excisionase family DNA binding protein
MGSTAVKLENAEPWASVADVARHLGVRKESVHCWIERRRMPAHRNGPLWKLKVSEVDGWGRDGHAAGAADAR